jgi:hypothetical protein
MVLVDVGLQGYQDVWAQHWFSTDDLGLNGALVDEWRAYTNLLSHNAIRLRDEDDELVWSWNKINVIMSTKLAYEALSIIWKGRPASGGDQGQTPMLSF